MARETFGCGNVSKSDGRILYVSFMDEEKIIELFYNYILAIKVARKVTGLFCLVLIFVCLFVYKFTGNTPFVSNVLFQVLCFILAQYFITCSFYNILQISQVLCVSFKT